MAALAEACVPPSLKILGQAEGLPLLPMFDLSLVPGPGEPTRLAARLQDFLLRELSREDQGGEPTGHRPRA